MRMYYYKKPVYGQEVIKSSQEFGKEAKLAGLDEDDKEWRFFGSNGRVQRVYSREDVDGLIVVEEIYGGHSLTEEGKYSIMVQDKHGKLVFLDGHYKNKAAAARYLPGLSMIYDYVAVVGEDVKPWVSRADVNYNLMEDFSF